MASRRCVGTARTTGNQCRKPPTPGTTVCHMHGSKAPQVQRRARQRQAVQEAQREVARLGLDLDAHPLDALAKALAKSYSDLAVFGALVGQLELEVRSDGRGIAGPNHLGDAVPHVFVQMHGAEVDRVARISKTLLDAGVDEKLVRIAEAQGQQLASVLRVAVRAAAEGGEQAGLEAAAAEMRRLRS